MDAGKRNAKKEPVAAAAEAEVQVTLHLGFSNSILSEIKLKLSVDTPPKSTLCIDINNIIDILTYYAYCKWGRIY